MPGIFAAKWAGTQTAGFSRGPIARMEPAATTSPLSQNRNAEGPPGAEPSVGRRNGAGPDGKTLPATSVDAAHVVLQMPVDVRSISLVVLATIASVFMLRWASAVFIPVMVGLLGSYALSPVVDWLQRRRIPRALSAALLILGALAGIGATGYSLSDDASRLVESLPAAAQKLRGSLRALPGAPDNTLATVQKAAAQLEQAADEANRPAPAGRGVQRVQIEKAEIRHQGLSLDRRPGPAGRVEPVRDDGADRVFPHGVRRQFPAQDGQTGRPDPERQEDHLAGAQPDSRPDPALHAGAVVHQRAGRVWRPGCAFKAIGLENAAVWGIAAGVLDLVPYIGSVVIATGSALMAFLQFGTLEMALAGQRRIPVHPLHRGLPADARG